MSSYKERRFEDVIFVTRRPFGAKVTAKPYTGICNFLRDRDLTDSQVCLRRVWRARPPLSPSLPSTYSPWHAWAPLNCRHEKPERLTAALRPSDMSVAASTSELSAIFRPLQAFSITPHAFI